MMKSHLILLSLATGSLAGALERAVCNADNCARAITGTRYAAAVQALHTADCSSFMIETITPATPTLTVTVTVTPTSYSVIGSNSKRTAAPEVIGEGLAGRNAANDALLLPPTITARSDASPADVAARQVTEVPSDVPIYASACSGAVRYSSACSCAGITKVTVYAPTPASATSTSYAAASIIPVCDPNTNYGFNYVGGSIEIGVSLQVLSLNVPSEQACCASCFPESSACFVYEYFNGICFIVTETGGSHLSTDYCPYGVFGISLSNAGNFYGLGPCAVFR